MPQYPNFNPSNLPECSTTATTTTTSLPPIPPLVLTTEPLPSFYQTKPPNSVVSAPPVSGGLPPVTPATTGGDVIAAVPPLTGYQGVSKKFDYITSLVKEDITTRRKSFLDLNGNPLSLYDVVAVALRRLGSGDSLALVGASLNLNQTTVAQITKLFVDILEVRGRCHVQWPESESEMESIKSKFKKIAGLPNCCGAIDTTHILMCLSTSDRSTNVWCDREKNQTMTLQTIVDADLRFRDVVGGWPGTMTDERIHKKSTFFKFCKNGERLNKRKELSNGNEIEEYIVGNLGFPLLPWLITPYRGKELGEFEVEFNQMVVKTQMVSQKALAKLKQNWKTIQGVMWRPDKNRLPIIILACCILHNILIDLEDEVQGKLLFVHRHDLDYHPAICDSDDDQNSSLLREKLSFYLSRRSGP